MADVKCTKCGTKISNVAGGVIKCPNCGHMMKLAGSGSNTQSNNNSQMQTQQKPTKNVNIVRAVSHLMQRCARSAGRNRGAGV